MQYQRARLEYQYNKLEKIHTGIYSEIGGNVEFELFSFFEICYHLKDWIIESLDHPQISEVDKFINESPALRISADICNRLKHKTLRHNKTKVPIENKRSLGPLGPFYIETILDVGSIPGMAKVTLAKATIQTERGNECCFALAKECMNEWARYFSENNVV